VSVVDEWSQPLRSHDERLGLGAEKAVPRTPEPAAPYGVVALDVAGDLIQAGMPVFAAPPALDGAGNWDPHGGHNGCGYWLPPQWEQTFTSEGWLNPGDPHLGLKAWRPGWAPCAVMGHRLDLVDVDRATAATSATPS
jgi:hypothetical protein